jgi:putative transposase
MPKGLRLFHNTGQRHFITCSCYRRQAFLGSARRRGYFLKVFEEVRQKYDLVVWGYVVMPEHFHILISEPAKGNVARVMQVLKQELSRACVKRRNRPIR